MNREFPFSDSPADKLHRAVPAAELLPPPTRACVHRREIDGAARIVLSTQSRSPTVGPWRVILYSRCLAEGSTPAEAVDRALFFWRSTSKPPPQDDQP